jgi:hypothetical protein
MSGKSLYLEKYSSGRRGSPAKGVDPNRMRGFKSLLLRHYITYIRSVVQLVERRSPKPNVVGSSPATPAKFTAW